MATRSTLLLASALTLAVVACSTEDSAPDVEGDDVGQVCAYALDPGSSDPFGEQPFTAGEPVHFTVTFEECASSCIENLETECTVTVDGERLVVKSSYSYDAPSGDGVCTADCNVIQATCTVGPLEDGTYTVEHGEETMPLVIPETTGSPPCME